MTRSARLLSGAAGLALLAGCGAAAQDAPPENAQPEASLQVSTPPPASSSPAPASPTALSSLRPCDLLSTVDRSTAGLPALGEEKAIGQARACDWTAPGTFGLTVTLDDKSGVTDLKVDKGTRKKVTIGERPAYKVADRQAKDGTCAVLLGAGDSASVQVDVNNASFSDTDLACERATTVAKLIEPKLP
ncbi:DUF3558 family protein [Amycolatopsis nigrescens]|uniref:DUF3558 family protein n=1 Tax=Amycolatopsis nigrescens TaxID=381445 RepID=UPI00037C8423|nr:DUF3558 family protein [Amycolatopsis nigrescens]